MDQAFRSVALVHLSSIAVRLERALAFDPETQRIQGDEDATAVLGRTYRPGHWATPAGAGREQQPCLVAQGVA